jgi:Zn-dependent oligopeptidase
MFSTFQELLGLAFEEVANPEKWHPDVLMYAVRDAAGPGGAPGPLVGYFYLDMFPREGKYGHAACWGLQPGCVLPGGARQLPVSACVCNFTKPTAAKPALLQFSEGPPAAAAPPTNETAPLR